MKNTGSNKLLRRLRDSLEELKEIDFGYELGENIIRPPSEDLDSCLRQIEDTEISHQILDFYKQCDGFSLPDIRNGLFVSRLVDLLKDKGQPIKITGFMNLPIMVFGSTGGGELFAMDKKTGNIFLLGPGLIDDRAYTSDSSNVTLLAENWEKFMERILSDVVAFVADDKAHHYIS